MADVIGLLEFWAENPPHGDLLRILAMSKGWKPKTLQQPAAASQVQSIAADFPDGILR